MTIAPGGVAARRTPSRHQKGSAATAVRTAARGALLGRWRPRPPRFRPEFHPGGPSRPAHTPRPATGIGPLNAQSSLNDARSIAVPAQAPDITRGQPMPGQPDDLAGREVQQNRPRTPASRRANPLASR